MVIVIFAGNNPFVFSLDFRNFAETRQTHPIDMQSVKYNYLICNRMSIVLPLLELDIWR